MNVKYRLGLGAQPLWCSKNGLVMLRLDHRPSRDVRLCRIAGDQFMCCAFVHFEDAIGVASVSGTFSSTYSFLTAESTAFHFSGPLSLVATGCCGPDSVGKMIAAPRLVWAPSGSGELPSSLLVNLLDPNSRWPRY